MQGKANPHTVYNCVIILTTALLCDSLREMVFRQPFFFGKPINRFNPTIGDIVNQHARNLARRTEYFQKRKTREGDGVEAAAEFEKPAAKHAQTSRLNSDYVKRRIAQAQPFKERRRTNRRRKVSDSKANGPAGTTRECGSLHETSAEPNDAGDKYHEDWESFHDTNSFRFQFE